MIKNVNTLILLYIDLNMMISKPLCRSTGITETRLSHYFMLDNILASPLHYRNRMSQFKT